MTAGAPSRRDRIAARVRAPHGARLVATRDQALARDRTVAIAAGVGVSWWGGDSEGFALRVQDDGALDGETFRLEVKRREGLAVAAAVICYAARHGGLEDFAEILGRVAERHEAHNRAAWHRGPVPARIVDQLERAIAPESVAIVDQVAGIYEREQRDAVPTWTIPHELGQRARAVVQARERRPS